MLFCHGVAAPYRLWGRLLVHMGAVATVAPVLGTWERLTVRCGAADAENALGPHPGSQSGRGPSAANSQRHINDLGVGAIGRKARDLTPRVRRGSQRLMISRGLLLMGDTSAGRQQEGSCFARASCASGAVSSLVDNTRYSAYQMGQAQHIG